MVLEITVDLPDDRAWRKRLGDMETGKFFRTARRGLLAQIGTLLVAKARAKAPKAFGTLAAAIDYKVRGYDDVDVGVIHDRVGPSGTTTTSEYGFYQERGTGPHMPPPGALRAWMARVGFSGPEFLAARAIARRGIQRQPFLAPALKESEKPIEELSRRAYQHALDQMAARPGAGILGRVRLFFRGRG